MADMNELNIIPYHPEFREQVIDLAISAWEPVFEQTRNEVPSFVYDAFWPQGWQDRQIQEVTALLDSRPETVWLSLRGTVLTGFLGICIHPEDQMGEVSIIAVSPDAQRKGVGKSLMEFAERHIRAAGMKMVMVETVGDTGHTPARRVYEGLGYERWPVARYFKQL